LAKRRQNGLGEKATYRVVVAAYGSLGVLVGPINNNSLIENGPEFPGRHRWIRGCFRRKQIRKREREKSVESPRAGSSRLIFPATLGVSRRVSECCFGGH
jgi:hypothetical protein